MKMLNRQQPSIPREWNDKTPFPSQSFTSMTAFLARRMELRDILLARNDREIALAPEGRPIQLPGRCGLCDKAVSFSADWEHPRTLADGRRMPNWRERLVCPCGLNSRLRASMHFMLANCGLTSDAEIYLTEQTTPFFELVRQFAPGTVGSEFLVDGTARGQCNRKGLRHEDVTQLTFANDRFDMLGSFDVLEHVPNYKAALREMARVLKPGGHAVLTFPYRIDLQNTLVRAVKQQDQTIKHLLPAEYHGDPMRAEGVLCYYHFGWDVLDDMRGAGFSHAACHMYWSWELGYLGGFGIILHGIR